MQNSAAGSKCHTVCYLLSGWFNWRCQSLNTWPLWRLLGRCLWATCHSFWKRSKRKEKIFSDCLNISWSDGTKARRCFLSSYLAANATTVWGIAASLASLYSHTPGVSATATACVIKPRPWRWEEDCLTCCLRTSRNLPPRHTPAWFNHRFLTGWSVCIVWKGVQRNCPAIYYDNSDEISRKFHPI